MNVYCTALEPFIVHGRSQTKQLSTSPMVFPRCRFVHYGTSLHPSLRGEQNNPSKCPEMRRSNCDAGFLWIQTIELKTSPWVHCMLKLLTQQTSGSLGRKWTRRPDNQRFYDLARNYLARLARCCQAFYSPTPFLWKKRSRLQLGSF